MPENRPGRVTANPNIATQLTQFRVSRRRRRMYCGHPRLCVCVTVRGRIPTLLHGP